jgi:hypothetical protein
MDRQCFPLFDEPPWTTKFGHMTILRWDWTFEPTRAFAVGPKIATLP